MSNSSTTTEGDLIEPIHPGEILINLQSYYELDRAEDLAGEQIAAIAPLRVS
ncbi:MAG: hypothetical protein GXY65_17155 [Rhodococcus sp.]|uniref:hypothetical protein n=1 Tax=Rhodococcus sp. TaxID=1831 RepID=UPI00169A93C2|nr:hypothetical protein [Rhodococcus sp. (in: high G+C Gram-positive bacteria)]NLV81032.1 hypothetical protein [Rhodococcus sp. (in: high G+C Gram-positive bacteria)]